MILRQFISYDRRTSIVAVVALATTLAGFIVMSVGARGAGIELLTITGDSKGYVILAQNLLERGVFSVAESEPLYPESFRAPGYPAFLSALFALFSFSTLALLAHALLTGTAPILLYVLLRDWHERTAFWASIVFAFEPIRIFLSSSFLSDALFTVIFLCMLLFIEQAIKEKSRGYAALAGVTLGFAILVRPIAMFLPLILVPYLILRLPSVRARVAYSGLLVICMAILVVPWMYRNYIHFGSWNVSSVGAANLMLYNAPEFLKWYPSESGKVALATFQAEQESLSREEALSLSRSKVFTATFKEVIRGAEIQYLTFHVVKTIPFFITDGFRDVVRLFGVELGAIPNISTSLMRGDVGTVLSYVRSGGLAIALLVIGVGFWSLVVLGMSLEAVRSLIRREFFSLFLVLLIGYFAILTGPVSNARYRVPIEGFMLALALHFLFRWYDARHAPNH